MSSGSSGRYQSKLFNFVHQQSRRLTAQWEHTFRHVQVATKWGVELLLYPVYLLLHSSQSSGKQLQTKEPQSRLQLEPESPPTADTPIQQVLETVQNLPSESSTDAALTTSPSFHPLTFLRDVWHKLSHHRPRIDATPSQSLTIAEEQTGNLQPTQNATSLKLNHLVVQGIATSLVNRHLVLVTPDNVILDILTPQQQAQLEERIINAIANYWRALRLFPGKQETALLPEIDRLLAKLTGSKSEHIPALPPGNAIKSELQPEYLSPSAKALAFMDAFVAKLEANALVPVQENSQEILEVVRTQFNIFLYGKEELAARGQIAVNHEGLESHTINLQELITAALNYFFGVSSDKNLHSGDFENKVSGKRLFQRHSQALPKGKQRQHEDLAADPWLSWSDLFGESQTPHRKTVAVPKPNPLPLVSSSFTPDSLPQNLTGSVQSRLKSPQQASGVKQKPKTTCDTRSRSVSAGLSVKPPAYRTPKQKIPQPAAITKDRKPQLSPSKNKSQKGELSQQRRQSTQMEAQPDWIDVEAIDVGYEKHILEQLLELLDSAMLWLEKLLIKIFQWLQQLWRGK
jgi:hypothetical protein